MAIDFHKEAISSLDPALLGMPPTDWKAVIEKFITKEEKVLALEMTGRDKHRSLSSVYTSINTALRQARDIEKPFPVKVTRKNGVLFLYRTDIHA